MQKYCRCTAALICCNLSHSEFWPCPHVKVNPSYTKGMHFSRYTVSKDALKLKKGSETPNLNTIRSSLSMQYALGASSNCCADIWGNKPGGKVYLDDCAFTRARLAAQCEGGSWRNVQREVCEHSDLRPWWVDEGDVPELHMAHNLVQNLASILFINSWLPGMALRNQIQELVL